MQKYYSLFKKDRAATVQIYGDITSTPLLESDVSSHSLSRQISDLDVDTISVYINSYGGEVAEGWAIYNALQRHPAKIHTYVDGFACSIASVIFMSGDVRSMYDMSLLMGHYPWICASGNSEELRKYAEDLEIMGELSLKAYLRHVNISKAQLQEMLNKERWICPGEAVSMGFATDIVQAPAATVAQQNAKEAIIQMILAKGSAAVDHKPDSAHASCGAKENKTIKFLQALIAPEGESKCKTLMY